MTGFQPKGLSGKAAVDELAGVLASQIEGEIRFDDLSRALYSTDASNHQVFPLGVVLPRSADDIEAIVKLAAAHDLPLLPRGAGTSLAGQAIGEALILDCSKYLNRILEIDTETRLATVEPGVVCAQLNRVARRQGLMYGPDPASADRATFGGMIGNNATGAHSIRYGMTSDNVTRLEVTLADGSAATFEALDESAWSKKLASHNLEGRIYRSLARIRREYSVEVERRWPQTWRRASGYSLNYLTGMFSHEPPAWYAPEMGYPPLYSSTNLAPVVVGSEGTLAVMRRAQVRLVPVPPRSLVVILPFPSVTEAVGHTPELLQSGPAAIELLPRTLLQRALAIPAYSRKMTFLESIPEALLVVEFAGEDEAVLLAQASEAAGSSGTILRDGVQQANLWEVRKAGLGLLMSVPGDLKPITFIEDVAVPVAALSSYVEGVEAVLADNGTSAEWYAHASAGCLHLRPLINLKTRDGVQQMRAIAEAVAELVLSLHGSLSGEHGDGLTHTEFNERLFGPALMQAFHEVKDAFDPQGILNPGKVVPSTRSLPADLEGPLRYGPDYQTEAPSMTYFAFAREGSLAGAIEACTGLGVCRKDEGLMCPSYQATRDENDLTRGRANALRLALSGALAGNPLSDRRVNEVLDLCLECKGCKSECPTAVDMAKVKAEFLAHYQKEHGTPLRSRLFAEINQVARTLQPFAAIANRLGSLGPVKVVLASALGIAPQRALPQFAPRAFAADHPTREARRGQPVVLFIDTYTRYMVPEVGQAALRVLRASGAAVTVLDAAECCGRPLISKGMLDRAKNLLHANVELLVPHTEQGTPIVVLEPSCASVFQDELPDLVPDDDRAAMVSKNVFLLEDFLINEQFGRPIDNIHFRTGAAGALLVHSHCHVKALHGAGSAAKALSAAGYIAEEIPSGCCGMAGSFGYEQEHYDVSRRIGELVLLPAARKAAARGQRVAAHGYSCRTQVQDGSEAHAVHPALLLDERLEAAS